MSEFNPMTPPTANLGVLCTAAAVILVLGSNLIDIGRFHQTMTRTRAQQQISLDNTGRAEKQLDSLAKGTKSLADAGNANAQAILNVLRQNGVQVNTGAPTTK